MPKKTLEILLQMNYYQVPLHLHYQVQLYLLILFKKTQPTTAEETAATAATAAISMTAIMKVLIPNQDRIKTVSQKNRKEKYTNKLKPTIILLLTCFHPIHQSHLKT